VPIITGRQGWGCPSDDFLARMTDPQSGEADVSANQQQPTIQQLKKRALELAALPRTGVGWNSAKYSNCLIDIAVRKAAPNSKS
jgi:hypothetical protein